MKAVSENRWFKMSDSTLARTIRSGLIHMLPILMIGSFALMLRSLPIGIYQEFITGFAGGAIYNLFQFISSGTFGMLSVYTTLSVSYAIAQEKLPHGNFNVSIPITALGSFFILTGVLTEGFDISCFGAQGMFTAILCAVSASHLVLFLYKKTPMKMRLFTEGVDLEFNQALSVLPAVLAVFLAAALFNLAVIELFPVDSFHGLFVLAMNQLFSHMGRTVGSGLLFVVMSSVLWFFGVHGSDVLEVVANSHFLPAIDINQGLVAAGGQGTEIITKTFLDSFVLMGGCGATLCLLVSLLLFSKRRGSRGLARLAGIPMLFNINELMVFGLPLIFNPVMLVPFVLTPVILFLTSYAAMSIGLVPVTYHAVEWTTPILLSGYLSTGSIAGSILQIFNLTVGVMIYRPFVKWFDEECNASAKSRMHKLVERLKETEENNEAVQLIYLNGISGRVARSLAGDLQPALERKELQLFFQPQFDKDMECIGAEALLRWNHPLYGMIYPPLVIKVAEESGMLTGLEEYVLTFAAQSYREIESNCRPGGKLSVNITVNTLVGPGFEEFLSRMKEEYQLPEGGICLEVTEQVALMVTDEVENLFQRIHEMGFEIAIDDFSMGHTSMKYLQRGKFDMVKLDGSLIKEMESNPRCQEIISSILHLAQSLGFQVLAEYVETESQKKKLEELGCSRYQGYLYSPAVPLEEYIERLKE